MIQIKTQELRDAVQAAYEFDKEHGVSGGCTITGGSVKETYSFNANTRIYYFEGALLTAFEDVV